MMTAIGGISMTTTDTTIAAVTESSVSPSRTADRPNADTHQEQVDQFSVMGWHPHHKPA